ncbi:hypothetical protein QCA50_021048 [Cerrena zonata]|uniref:Uncharacterized protein n=1 Tax=Cerrena zonata TaxID=2478898 RepID=A0AAW0FFH0_9APHY
MLNDQLGHITIPFEGRRLVGLFGRSTITSTTSVNSPNVPTHQSIVNILSLRYSLMKTLFLTWITG